MFISLGFSSLMFIPFALLYWLFEPKPAKLFLNLPGNVTKYLLLVLQEQI